MVGVEASIDSVFNMVFSSSRSNAACVERNFSRKRDLPLGSDKNEFADRLDTKKKKKETRTRIRKSNVEQLSRSLGNDDIYSRAFAASNFALP